MIGKIISRMIDIIEGINKSMHWPVIILLISMTFLINLEVIMRYIFNRPTQFTTEFCQIIQVALAMLGAGYVLKNKGHVNVEIVFMTLRGKWRAYVGFVFSLLGVLYCGVLAWLGWLSVESSISVGERSFDLGLYLWPVKTLFVLGICLFGLQFIVDSYEYFNSYRDGKN